MLATGPTPPNIAFSQNGMQEITLTVANGQCQEVVTQFIDAEGAPFSTSIDKEDALCYGDKGSIDLTVNNGKAPFIYKWSNSTSVEDPTNLNPGKYAYTVTDANGCSSTGEVEILGATQPLVIKPKVVYESCTGTKNGFIEIDVLNSGGQVNFEWSTGATANRADSLTAGNYSVTLTDANGCQLDTAFAVKTLCTIDEKELITDVFSPNGDGFNDLWNIPMIENYPDHVVQIFNRWGNIIWESHGNFMGWDGRTSSGEEALLGSYYFVIELNDPANIIFKGSVSVLR